MSSHTQLQVDVEFHDASYDTDESEFNSLFDSSSPIEPQLEFPTLYASYRLIPPSHNVLPPPSRTVLQALQAPSMIHAIPPAQITCPDIPGLFFFPSVLIPQSLEDTLIYHTKQYFHPSLFENDIYVSESEFIDKPIHPCINQAMLFGRHTAQGSGLPPFLDELIPILSALLKPIIPANIHSLLFSHINSASTEINTDGGDSSTFQSRQAILNHYNPGEGITPHVDLLNRFGDGILGISLGSGTVMTFERVPKLNAELGPANSTSSSSDDEQRRYDIYLPERSLIILTGEARYNWTHGIEGRKVDYVEKVEQPGEYTYIERKKRISITLRWLLPGADVVGGD